MSTSTFETMMREAKDRAADTQARVEMAIRERERKQREARQKAEQVERKERELAAKMRERHFENLKREEERKRKEEQNRKAEVAARERREKEQRDQMMYGPKKTGGSSGLKRSRSFDADEAPGGNFLTREEKRAKKDAETLWKDTPKRSAASSSRSVTRPGAKLRGGVANVMASSGSASPSSGATTRERLMAQGGGLIKLNQNKRDTRTIDEIVNDLQHKKHGSAEPPKFFDDWFGGDKAKTTSQPSSNGSQRVTLTAPATPVRKPPVTAPPSRPSSSAATSKPKPAPRPPYRPTQPSSTVKPKPSSSLPASKKRSRSRSRSESPPPRERDRPKSNLRSMVWDAMGFKGDRLPSAREVMSDDEDMEADAWSLEEEEVLSAKIAKREEIAALAEEKRHEEEKRRKRMKQQRG